MPNTSSRAFILPGKAQDILASPTVFSTFCTGRPFLCTASRLRLASILNAQDIDLEYYIPEQRMRRSLQSVHPPRECLTWRPDSRDSGVVGSRPMMNSSSATMQDPLKIVERTNEAPFGLSRSQSGVSQMLRRRAVVGYGIWISRMGIRSYFGFPRTMGDADQG